jgi:hypothetical protein
MWLTYEYGNFNGRPMYIASVLDCCEDGFVAYLVDCHLECHVDTMLFLLDCMSNSPNMMSNVTRINFNVPQHIISVGLMLYECPCTHHIKLV